MNIRIDSFSVDAEALPLVEVVILSQWLCKTQPVIETGDDLFSLITKIIGVALDKKQVCE